MGKVNATTRCKIQPYGARWERLLRASIFACASHQTRLDTRSKARRPIKVEIKGRGRSGMSRGSNPADLCCSSAHLVQCEPDEPSGFTGPRMGPGTYASLRLKLDSRSSAIQGVPKETKMQLAHPEVASSKLGALKASTLPLFLCRAQTSSRERPRTSEFSRRRSLFFI